MNVWMLFCISLSLVIVSHLSTVRWLRKHRVEWSTVQDFPSPPPLNIINLKSTQPFNLCRSDMNWLISLLWVRLLYASRCAWPLKKNNTRKTKRLYLTFCCLHSGNSHWLAFFSLLFNGKWAVLIPLHFSRTGERTLDSVSACLLCLSECVSV